MDINRPRSADPSDDHYPERPTKTKGFSFSVESILSNRKEDTELERPNSRSSNCDSTQSCEAKLEVDDDDEELSVSIDKSIDGDVGSPGSYKSEGSVTPDSCASAKSPSSPKHYPGDFALQQYLERTRMFNTSPTGPYVHRPSPLLPPGHPGFPTSPWNHNRVPPLHWMSGPHSLPDKSSGKITHFEIIS